MNGNKCVLVTGGAGYIGSHCVVELLNAGYDVVVVDNFTNSVGGRGKPPSLTRAELITGCKVHFYKCDLLDKIALKSLFNKHKVGCVLHLAAVKAVGESMMVPLVYYKNNVVGTLTLIEVMADCGVYKMVFSSSCTVYGNPVFLPITENHPTGQVSSVYGRTKYLTEEMLRDLCRAEKKWDIISLRYFNPVGAHPSGLIGEDPTKAFPNLMPSMAQVAIGGKPELVIYGGDYDTVDGTGVRDYIHIMDLSSAHMAAINKLEDSNVHYKVYNIGTGKGYSVLQMLNAFEKASGKKIATKIQERRSGDVASVYADSELAQYELGWSATHTLEQMCADFWRWQTKNPTGYREIASNGYTNGSNINGSNGVH